MYEKFMMARILLYNGLIQFKIGLTLVIKFLNTG